MVIEAKSVSTEQAQDQVTVFSHSRSLQTAERPATQTENHLDLRHASRQYVEDELQPSGASSHVQHTSAINGTVHLRFKNR